MLNLTKTYFTRNITTDIIDNIIDEDTIDKCNALTMAYEKSLGILFLPGAVFSYIFLISCMKCRSNEVKKRNLKNIRRIRAKRFQPPSYAELSRDYPSPPSFEDLSPPGFEDLQQVDSEIPEPEETPQDESSRNCTKMYSDSCDNDELVDFCNLGLQ